jgi:hypothetical protein
VDSDIDDDVDVKTDAIPQWFLLTVLILLILIVVAGGLVFRAKRSQKRVFYGKENDDYNLPS